MAQQRLRVRKIREVLRLKAAGMGDRKIAQAIGSARSTVQECMRRAREAGTREGRDFVIEQGFVGS